MPTRRSAILLVDHGSRASEANRNLEAIAILLARRAPNSIVRAAHMELAPPTLSEALRDCVGAGAERVIVHPYFIAPGRHSREDIPRMLREAALVYPDLEIRVTEPLGIHEKLVDVILERVEAAGPLETQGG